MFRLGQSWNLQMMWIFSRSIPQLCVVSIYADRILLIQSVMLEKGILSLQILPIRLLITKMRLLNTMKNYFRGRSAAVAKCTNSRQKSRSYHSGYECQLPGFTAYVYGCPFLHPDSSPVQFYIWTCKRTWGAGGTTHIFISN